MSQLFLGFDCSTQSLTAVIIDYLTKKIIYKNSINFDRELPEYQTVNGALGLGLEKTTPPLLWIEALDLLFQKMNQDGVDLQSIYGISGSGQQHGSVYLNSIGVEAIKNLNPLKSLKENLENGFSRAFSPIWMDSSTTLECEEIERQNPKNFILETTGSLLYERFTGPQIRKFYKNDRASYEKTAAICLISSFFSSLLSGTLSDIDECDASGMNLMDIKANSWNPNLLDATAPSLASKLAPIAKPWKVIGQIAPYFATKYGVNPKALSVIWSGDNPNTLIGLGLKDENEAAVSLGTSYTYFGPMKEYSFHKGAHVFRAPTGHFMPLICFKNGALALDKIRSNYSLTWEDFQKAVAKTPPGNKGRFLLPYFEPEIVPKVLNPKISRFNLSVNDLEGNCRAILESQMIALKIHSEWTKTSPKLIYATGGASKNQALLQVMADVFNCQVLVREMSDSAALGAAFRACHAYYSTHIPFDELTQGFFETNEKSIEPKSSEAYTTLIREYEQAETDFLARNEREHKLPFLDEAFL